jgi:hypothetical protein
MSIITNEFPYPALKEINQNNRHQAKTVQDPGIQDRVKWEKES